MWYFSVKENIQFFKPSEYGLALSSILHSSDTSMFFLFQSHMKLNKWVTFPLLLYLKEFSCLYIFKRTLSRQTIKYSKLTIET